MFCLKCGKQINDDSVFCSYCGAPQTAGATNPFCASASSAAPAPVDPSKVLFKGKESVWKYSKSMFWNIFLALIFIGGAICVTMYLPAFVYAKYVVIGLGVLTGICLLNIFIRIIVASKCELLFYKDRFVQKSGIFSTHEKQTVLTMVQTVNLRQSLLGRILKFGHVHVDYIGKGNLEFKYIKDPKELEKYLESIIATSDYSKMRQMVVD